MLDFTKAFDKVPHGRLISKLEYYGIKGPTLNWLKAFLTNREQTVVVEGKASAPVKVASGVPQGTVLGPLLFLLYINDLPDQLDSNVRLFADDCLLYVELSTQTDSQLLQKDLNTLEEWQSKWLMQFNPEKCYIMHMTNKRTPHATSYQFCGQALATTKIHPYLAVTLTSGLKWGAHVAGEEEKCDAWHLREVQVLLYQYPSDLVFVVVASGGVMVDHSTVNRETRVRSRVVPGTCLNMRPDVVPLGKALNTTFLTPSRCEWVPNFGWGKPY
ncbi:hypothetical protein Bbelb_020750 [Branchiostoma belcheri]|nr:hypothetical protein Bbelb_020750 [Branchiostoma belcheri]